MTLAYLNPSKAIAKIQSLVHQHREDHISRQLRDHGFQPSQVAIVYAERLLSYQWSREGIEPAVEEWSKVFEAWAVPANRTVMRAYFEERCEKRSPPAPQSSRVFNWDVIRKTILASGDQEIIRLLDSD